MNPILQVKTSLSVLSDEKIIEGLQKTINSNELRLIEFEFYNRYSEYTYKAGLQKFRNFNDSDFLAREVLQNTFITAFAKIGKFKFPARSPSSNHQYILKAWLGKIANNESKKSRGKIINSNIEYDSLNLPEPFYDQFENIYGEKLVEIPNEFRQKLQAAMNKLSEKERDVVLTYADEGCINTNRQQHISDSALQYLCEYYNTTTEAIKQCKKRALDKIKKNCFD